ncbi:MAG: hypothetical protein JJ868_05450 [Shimia sp.]|uniref:hypothetical protein n=1 Tax=Shimia sp. TaxID=1954381 RepID=UPI0019EE2871|nr:hypothetical protein [Shimia sp.]MBE1292607.1 hypothetical protein [Paracoccaceae bacterium]MBO6896800.1 hypothetical protein [Shimia sp.]
MKNTAFAVVAALAATPVVANEYEPAMAAFLNDNIRTWAQDPILVSAIKAQNEVTAGYDQATIDQMDTTWRAEVGAASTPTITPVIENPAADFLRTQVENSAGQITEIALMDSVGLNVALSGVNSDMWQGDEAKYQQTYSVGPDAYHFSEVELDDSTRTYQVQISMTIVDPETGVGIGAITVGVDAETLE